MPTGPRSADQQKQILREFAANAEEVLGRTGDLQLLEEIGRRPACCVPTAASRRASTWPTCRPAPRSTWTPHRPGLTVTEARVIAEFYDPSDVLQWVTDALTERYPAVDFSAVYE